MKVDKGQHEKMVKLSKKVNKHLAEVSHLQHKVFKLLLRIKNRRMSESDYHSIKSLVNMYRDNEKELSKVVEIYEARLSDYEYEKDTEKVNLHKGDK